MFRVFEGVCDRPDSLSPTPTIYPETEKACDGTGFLWARNTIWQRSQYESAADAIDYANKWLGDNVDSSNRLRVIDLPYFFGEGSYVIVRKM